MLKTEQVVNKIIEALEDNKAHRIVKIDLRKIENCFCSFFVICHGTSGTHIAGLTDAVEEKVREDLDERPFHIEGLNAAQWVVVDYGDIVVHIFEKELRDYYQLEDFWADAQITEIAGNAHLFRLSYDKRNKLKTVKNTNIANIPNGRQQRKQERRRIQFSSSRGR